MCNEDETTVMSMNWTRNPFGLCQWMEDNADVKTRKSLWYVTNHWNYKKSRRVNRKLFLEVVKIYNDAIQKLEKGYFYFTLPGYLQFVEPVVNILPKSTIFKLVYEGYDDQNRMKIPMTKEAAIAFNLHDMTLNEYKVWASKLMHFAEILQNKNIKFYCSN